MTRTVRALRPPQDGIPLSLDAIPWEPETCLPAQWQDGPEPTGAEKMAAACVLDAIGLLIRYRHRTSSHARQVQAEEGAWLASDDRTWPYAFRNLCDALGWDAARVRQQTARLLAEVPRRHDPAWGDRLRTLREQRGWRAKDVAAMLGVTSGTLRDYELGHCVPSPANRARVEAWEATPMGATSTASVSA